MGSKAVTGESTAPGTAADTIGTAITALQEKARELDGIDIESPYEATLGAARAVLATAAAYAFDSVGEAGIAAILEMLHDICESPDGTETDVARRRFAMSLTAPSSWAHVRAWANVVTENSEWLDFGLLNRGARYGC